jgi:hypothetical protein
MPIKMELPYEPMKNYNSFKTRKGRSVYDGGGVYRTYN